MLALPSTAVGWMSAGSLRVAQVPDLIDVISEFRPAVQALVARVLRRGRQDADVEDCVNEAFRRALEGRERLLEGHPERPWLLGIARHVALDHLRAQQRSQAREARPRASDAEPAVDPVAQLADPHADPEALALHRQRAARLQAELETLPASQREALVLFHVEGLSYREISERLGAPVGTVGTWVLRARQGLAVALGELQSRPPGEESHEH